MTLNKNFGTFVSCRELVNCRISTGTFAEKIVLLPIGQKLIYNSVIFELLTRSLPITHTASDAWFRLLTEQALSSGLEHLLCSTRRGLHFDYIGLEVHVAVIDGGLLIFFTFASQKHLGHSKKSEMLDGKITIGLSMTLFDK